MLEKTLFPRWLQNYTPISKDYSVSDNNFSKMPASNFDLW